MSCQEIDSLMNLSYIFMTIISLLVRI